MISPDPMGFARDLGCVAIYHPLGFPLRLSTNSQLVMSSAAASWSAFPAAFSLPSLELQVLVEEAEDKSHAEPPLYRGREHLFTIIGGHDVAVCDSAQGFAFCRLSETTASQTAFTAYYYLEAIAMHYLTQRYLTPLHAACITKQGRGVLLCGRSGAGKTSLAYASARRGWCYVSDNESWLLRDHSRLTALGTPMRIRFRENAGELFPELGSEKPFLFANGKMSLTLETRDQPAFSTAFQADISQVVFLDRGNRTGLHSVPKEEAFNVLLAGVPAYSHPVRQEHEASLRRLVSADTVRLSYTTLETGLDLLETV
jgi:hypothetical protein